MRSYVLAASVGRSVVARVQRPPAEAARPKPPLTGERASERVSVVASRWKLRRLTCGASVWIGAMESGADGGEASVSGKREGGRDDEQGERERGWV